MINLRLKAMKQQAMKISFLQEAINRSSIALITLMINTQLISFQLIQNGMDIIAQVFLNTWRKHLMFGQPYQAILKLQWDIVFTWVDGLIISVMNKKWECLTNVLKHWPFQLQTKYLIIYELTIQWDLGSWKQHISWLNNMQVIS